MALTSTDLRPETALRSVTILGSTGSIGCNTVDLIQRNPKSFIVEALTANQNVALLAEQALKLRPKIAVTADPSRFDDLKKALAGSSIEVAAGAEAVIEAASRPADIVMVSIVGAAGLAPALAAIRRGAIIGLANKECLVSAGDLMMKEVRRYGANMIPVDSEHSAIYQVFESERAASVERIILTASGGPFREMSSSDMAHVTPEQAVAHPNWSMGAKISVDSATMANKGLELIEAHHLFSMPEDRIDVLVHPQSVVHGLVAYNDGSVLAQMGTPDMRTPISYALGWPDRMASPSPRLSLAEVGKLTFEAPDLVRFPALKLARQALQNGGGAPTVFNAANEVAVHHFLGRRIGFLDIVRIIEQVLEKVPARRLESLDDVDDIDDAARRAAEVFSTVC
ncbi:MAG: 1-deoxy-D-xylulose-5-phosphate reductoisomerase [Rhodospirillales bacterium RIFCSPLOWO2_12_FULL_58_28]|nr:MAG: 1-deoxy-D-xylulose-5-phosphate reductoisomerase [Rhodospirillales bacterium RIFCSPLOWO2_02_FULL_58_16]OHC77967.1 MAG: 1-deoxy-D-xylulose-5-phosphate reductoisomerase [Rhodospirillales bacterium RIFCSPLOWO2_12_FULL_58_28]